MKITFFLNWSLLLIYRYFQFLACTFEADVLVIKGKKDIGENGKWGEGWWTYFIMMLEISLIWLIWFVNFILRHEPCKFFFYAVLTTINLDISLNVYLTSYLFPDWELLKLSWETFFNKKVLTTKYLTDILLPSSTVSWGVKSSFSTVFTST